MALGQAYVDIRKQVAQAAGKMPNYMSHGAHTTSADAIAAVAELAIGTTTKVSKAAKTKIGHAAKHGTGLTHTAPGTSSKPYIPPRPPSLPPTQWRGHSHSFRHQ
jgi:hypothetical protein